MIGFSELYVDGKQLFVGLFDFASTLSTDVNKAVKRM